MHNISTVDSVSSVQRVAAAAAANGPGINHGFAASRTVPDFENRSQIAVTIPDKDSAEIYASER